MNYEVKKIQAEDGSFFVPARERLLKLKLDGHDYELGVAHDTKEYSSEKVQIIARATLVIHVNSGNRTFTGTAAMWLNMNADGYEYEMTETKAIGRACAAFGIAIEDNYESYDGMKPLLAGQKVPPIDMTHEEAQALNQEVAESLNRGKSAVKDAEQRVSGRKPRAPKVKEVIPEEPVPTIPAPGAPMDLSGAAPLEENQDAPPNLSETGEENPFAQPVEDAHPIGRESDQVAGQPITEAANPSAPLRPNAAFGDKPEKPVGKANEKKAGKETEIDTSENKFGIVIPPMLDRKERTFRERMQLSKAIEDRSGVTLEIFRKKFIEIFPDSKDMDESDILGLAKKDSIEATLNKIYADMAS